MIFLLLAISLSHETPLYHFCNHDEIQRQTQVQGFTFEKSKLKMRSNEREPIRINLDFRIDKDAYQCTETGQTISWQGTTFTCEDVDVPNETQKLALQKTMENVQSYLQSIILVDRLDSPIQIRPSQANYFTLTDPPTTVSNTDIFLSIFIRTYGESQTLASAHYVSIDSDTHRPIQGAIYSNSRYLPLEAQNEASINTNFFYTVVHEIMHALGVSSDSFPYFHPKDSNTPYSNPLVELKDTTTGKNHKFLVTPYSHKFAVMQWGVENFTINGQSVPSGIEIEDGGGQGTAGSHPECRIGNQDLMVGVSLQGDNGPYSRFTPLTAAILLDTGNYDIVWDKIQPLVWGNKDSIDGNYIKDFVTGPPANVFPQQYIYRPSVDPSWDRCGFTFKMLGGLNKINISGVSYYDCTKEEYKQYANTKDYCDAVKFYNPNGDDEIGGSWPYDFQIVHFPTLEICGTGSACIAGMFECGNYKIAADEKSFSISIDGVEVECNENNVGKIFTEVGQYVYKYGFKCPPIEQFIRTVRMMENQQYVNGDPFNPKEDENPTESSSESDEQKPIQSEEEETPSIDQTNEPSKEDPKPSIDDSYRSSSSEITFTENGYKESGGEENSVVSKEEDILLIKTDQQELTIISGNSNKGNLFVSPQVNDPIITIKASGDQGNLNGEIGIDANSKNPKVKLPQANIPLNLFNKETSRIKFESDQNVNSVPISLKKLTISDGSIHIDVPDGTTGVEFNEVETFSNGKIETYVNDKLSETSIGSLKMNQGSNIEVTNAKFSNSITCGSGSKMKIDGKAKFNDETTISLTDTSLINFGDSAIEGICKEIVILDSNQRAIEMDDNEASASVICGLNFDCDSWKEKYSQKSAKYPYATCTKSDDNSETCLTVKNKSEPSPTKKKKGLPKAVIIGIVVVCVVVVIIIIVAIAVCARRHRNYDGDQYP